MTEPDYLIVLYSKYSPICKQVLNLYNQSTIDFMKFLCIDNSNTRQQLMNSKKLSVSRVPCVLLMYPGGKMEKFEEGDVASWLETQIRGYLPEDNITEVEHSSPSPPPPLEVPIQETRQEHTSILDLDPSMIQEEPTDRIHADTETTKKSKSVAEIAADMAAMREVNDLPFHAQKHKMQGS